MTAGGNAAQKVLIIDDDVGLVKTLEAGFKASGFEVVSAAAGQEGLDKAGEAAPDLIVLDLMLPDMSGYDVLGRLKANPATGNIPIMLVTVKGLEADIKRGLELGAEDYITKPVHRGLLLKRAQRILKKAGRPVPNV